ncbi:MAG: YihY/virulence factor BrkB family protein [Legionella longbeachae]|nr:YihY/virulence factor BrkB family protein [Legionella longbeachae]
MLIWTKTLYNNWNKDRVASRAAALAYYTIFSLAPILLISISLAGTFFGEEEAKGQLLAQISSLLGTEIAFQIQGIINNAHPPASALFTRIISIFILIFSSSGVFSEIQEGLNTIWRVKSDPKQGWFHLIKRRFLSFAMVLVFAFLLLVSLIISAFLTFLSSHINYFQGNNILIELFMSDIISFFIITILFAMIFKYLPDVRLPWKCVWSGALVTSLLFSLGKIGIGLYLHQVHIASVFGAAGFLIVLLIWVYYSAQIFFIGAEITKINAEKGAL